jgi:uncharacterized protein (TIGR02147 family)
MATIQTTERPSLLRNELRREFLRRCKTNESYSMRAFAGYLDIDQSLLSKIISGRRSIGARLAEQLALRLNVKTTPSPDYIQLLDDQVSVLSEWTHFAILELAKTKGFKLDKKWMATRLGVKPTQIEDALERLVRMKMISIQHDKLKLLKANNAWNNNASTTFARKELQRSLLELSQKTLENTPFEEREHGSLTVAVRKSRMPEFKEKLKQVRDELDAFFQPAEDAEHFDEVYQLTLSLFPVTKKTKATN